MKFERIDYPDDPERCEAHDPQYGMCPYKRLPGARNCARHGGVQTLRSQAQKRKRVYYLNKWQSRVEQLATHPRIKDLYDEVGIMRMMLEETLNQCGDSHELMLHSRTVTQCVDKIQKLIETIDRIESRQALPPNILVNLAGEWVKIINLYITDPVVLEELSVKLVGVIENVGGQQAITESRSNETSYVGSDGRDKAE